MCVPLAAGLANPLREDCPIDLVRVEIFINTVDVPIFRPTMGQAHLGDKDVTGMLDVRAVVDGVLGLALS